MSQTSLLFQQNPKLQQPIFNLLNNKFKRQITKNKRPRFNGKKPLLRRLSLRLRRGLLRFQR